MYVDWNELAQLDRGLRDAIEYKALSQLGITRASDDEALARAFNRKRIIYLKQAPGDTAPVINHAAIEQLERVFPLCTVTPHTKGRNRHAFILELKNPSPCSTETSVSTFAVA